MISIAVLTTTYRRNQELRLHLESLVRAERFSDVHVLVLINGVDVQAEALLSEYVRKYSNIRFIKSERFAKGKARNVLMAKAKEADVFYFLDDDCQVPQNAFSVLMDIAEANPDIDCFGGPNLTPPGANTFTRAQGYALGSLFGAFWVRDRYRIYGKPRLADDRSLILCNLAIRSKLFKQAYALFNEALVCAEENLLIQNLISAGHRCMHVPHLSVFHERRNSVPKFFCQVFIYGQGRCQIIKKSRGWNWLVYILSGFAVTGLCLFFWMYYGAILTTYIVLCVVNAAAIAVGVKDKKVFWPILYIFPIIHAGYLLGFIWGLFMPARNICHLLVRKGSISRILKISL